MHDEIFRLVVSYDCTTSLRVKYVLSLSCSSPGQDTNSLETVYSLRYVRLRLSGNL